MYIEAYSILCDTVYFYFVCTMYRISCIYVVFHIVLCIYVTYYSLIHKFIYYILYKYPNKLLHYGKEKNSWMWGHSGGNICHPIDRQGWFCWSGWLGSCPLPLAGAEAPGGWSFFGQGYMSSCAPPLAPPNKLSGTAATGRKGVTVTQELIRLHA